MHARDLAVSPILISCLRQIPASLAQHHPAQTQNSTPKTQNPYASISNVFIKAVVKLPSKVWFQGGPEDPTLVLVCVKPESTVYRDTKNNKMIQLIKMAASLVTGKTMDDGVEGKLRV
jgi:hypothetical protein